MVDVEESERGVLYVDLLRRDKFTVKLMKEGKLEVKRRLHARKAV